MEQALYNAKAALFYISPESIEKSTTSDLFKLLKFTFDNSEIRECVHILFINFNSKDEFVTAIKQANLDASLCYYIEVKSQQHDALSKDELIHSLLSHGVYKHATE